MATIPSFLTLLTLVPVVAAYEYHATYCGSNSSTYLPNSTYQTNLHLLLNSLYTSAAQNNRYTNNTYGRHPPNIAYGQYLCRGDIIPNDCRNCVQTVADNIITQCPNQKEAAIWYDDCMLRYSNSSVFGYTAESPVKHDCNKVNITEPDRFQQLMITTMIDLATQASRNVQGPVKRFATKEVRFNSSQLLYGLVQCTPDLLDVDCDRCLRINIDRLPKFCSGRQGARVLTPSCNVRYEMYSFYYISSSSSASPNGKKKLSSKKVAAIIASVCALLVLLVLCGIGFSILNKKARRRHSGSKKPTDDVVGAELITEQSLQYDLDTIEAATNNFSPENKIGEGGFGPVYKGVLSNGQEIAVKRLSRSSGQGVQEFKNEVVVVAKLQHRNLVRLLGYCLDTEEKILIYEYVPNHSLDYFLFDPVKQRQLDWSRRYKIIGGIARGLLYLHEDSRLRIIHRDLKTSNILLDKDMNPKISDFGMARIFGVNQTQATTNRVVGTFGYMAPEYAMHGHLSTKSDVFSFGVLVLEIINGKRNNSFYHKDGTEDLLCFAWKKWREGTPAELIEPNLADSCSTNEVIRCINIGLLCVQEHVEARPSMASVVLMLNSNSVALPLPQKPPYFNRSKSEQMMSKELDSEESISNFSAWSMDQLSVTELDQQYPMKTTDSEV